MAKRKTTKRQAAHIKDDGFEQSMYFNPLDPQHRGHFSPWGIIDYGRANQNAEDRVSEFDRTNLIAQSRVGVARLAELDAAFKRFGDLVIGTALIPLYNNNNKDWAKVFKKNVLDLLLNNLTSNGIGLNWQAMWRLALRSVYIDGDILMIPYRNRYGLPKLEFVEGHRITSRAGETTVKAGRYEGYDCNDGVIKDSASNPIAFQILGNTVAEDYTISTANAFLIASPFSFDSPRGIPILSAGANIMANLLDYQRYIPQIVKHEAQIQHVETNQEGKAPPGRTAFNSARTATGATAGLGGQGMNISAVTEYTQAGIRYIKTAGGKLEPFQSNRPHNEVQEYIKNDQKALLSILFPYQLILSPENLGGPGARATKELLVASLGPARQMIEQYALLALQHVISTVVTNPNLLSTFNVKTNFAEDSLDWSFSKAPEPVFDLGQERSADLNDKAAGLTSDQAIVAKEGKLLEDVNKEIDFGIRAKADLITQFQIDYPHLAANAPSIYGWEQAKTQPPIVEPPPQSTQEKPK